MNHQDGPELRALVAVACRLLAFRGLARETTGHVSARLGGDAMLIRCRTEGEAGLAFTTPAAIAPVGFDGTVLEPAGHHEPPSELPIHAEIFRRRPEVGAVVHAHPPMAVLCTLAGLSLEPIFGGYDPNAMFLGWEGVPVYPRSCLIRDAATAAEMAEAMGDHPVCLLHGHGTVAVGRSVEEAVLRTIQLETLATMVVDCARLGSRTAGLSVEDRAFFGRMREKVANDRHMADVIQWTWNHHAALLDRHERLAG